MEKVCQSPLCKKKFNATVHNQRYCNLGCKRDVENIGRRRNGLGSGVALAQEIQMTETIEEMSSVLNQEELVTYLRQNNQRLARENARLKHEKLEFHNAFFDGVQQAMTKIDLQPIPVPARKDKAAPATTLAEEAVAMLSDWQLGKKTIDYGVDVCEKRLDLYMDKLFRVTDIQRKDHGVANLRAWMLGDMVEGEAIFPSQSHHIESSLYTQIMKTSELIAKNIMRRGLQYFDSIHFVGISGNHGAIGGKSRNEIHPETNADRLVYKTVQLILENEPRVTWDIPDGTMEGDFYTIDTIGNKKVLLLHGHQIKGAGSIATIERRITRWSMILKEKFDYVAMGHFHNSTRYTINDVILYINGTTESSNGWSVEVMGKTARPCQYLLYMHPEHGVTAEYPIYLD